MIFNIIFVLVLALAALYICLKLSPRFLYWFDDILDPVRDRFYDTETEETEIE